MTFPLASECSYNEALVRVASIHNRTVAFRYAKDAKAPIETRALVPQYVNKTQDGHVTFSGYDPDRGAPRAFRLDRIKGDVQILGSL